MRFALKSRIFALLIDVFVAFLFSSIFCAFVGPSASVNPSGTKLFFQGITMLLRWDLSDPFASL
jgi:hypothetical protein